MTEHTQHQLRGQGGFRTTASLLDTRLQVPRPPTQGSVMQVPSALMTPHISSMSQYPCLVLAASHVVYTTCKPLASTLEPCPVTNGEGYQANPFWGWKPAPWQDTGCTHGLEVTVNDLLHVEHLQTLQDREGEAPNDGETEALETVVLHQLIQVDSGTERERSSIEGIWLWVWTCNINPLSPGCPLAVARPRLGGGAFVSYKLDFSID